MYKDLSSKYVKLVLGTLPIPKNLNVLSEVIFPTSSTEIL